MWAPRPPCSRARQIECRWLFSDTRTYCTAWKHGIIWKALGGRGGGRWAHHRSHRTISVRTYSLREASCRWPTPRHGGACCQATGLPMLRRHYKCLCSGSNPHLKLREVDARKGHVLSWLGPQSWKSSCICTDDRTLSASSLDCAELWNRLSKEPGIGRDWQGSRR